MKITKGYLKKVILEELNRLEEIEEFINLNIKDRINFIGEDGELIPLSSVGITILDGDIDKIKINNQVFDYNPNDVKQIEDMIDVPIYRLIDAIKSAYRSINNEYD